LIRFILLSTAQVLSSDMYFTVETEVAY